MSCGQSRRDPDERAVGAGILSSDVELTLLRAGADPNWERPHRNGIGITHQPALWTAYQRHRREAYEARVAQYRADGLIC